MYGLLGAYDVFIGRKTKRCGVHATHHGAIVRLLQQPPRRA